MGKKASKGGPRRPASSFIFYCTEKRSEVKDENPGFNSKQIVKELGRLWKLDKEKKSDIWQKCVDLASTATAEYKIKLAVYESEMKNKEQSEDNSTIIEEELELESVNADIT